MTNKEALGYWKAVYSEMGYMPEHHRSAVACAIDALRTAVEGENSPVDERKSRGSINVSAEDKLVDNGELRGRLADINDTLNWLTNKVRKLERELYGE